MRGLSAGLILLTLSVSALAAEPAYISIIIDDIGHNYERGDRAINLPASLTFAVLPHTTYGEELARRAYAAGKEVMVHMPMANISDRPIGPGGLESKLAREDFVTLFKHALSRVPHASGVNNHMGSYLTQQETEMDWLMDELKRRGLFFVDSRTTPKTVALDIARRKQVVTSSRDVFLDNERTFFEIDRAFRLLIAKAKRNGTAIAIGHPHDVTLDYLEMALPMLQAQNVHLLRVSNLIMLQQMIKLRFATAPGTASSD